MRDSNIPVLWRPTDNIWSGLPQPLDALSLFDTIEQALDENTGIPSTLRSKGRKFIVKNPPVADGPGPVEYWFTTGYSTNGGRPPIITQAVYEKYLPEKELPDYSNAEDSKFLQVNSSGKLQWNTTSGLEGKDGITPHIGANGNWFRDDEDTGMPSRGPKGDSGAIPTIGADGYWYLNEVTTGIKAQGENGAPGNDGNPGLNGKSAFELAQAGGYPGTETDWIASLKGVPGKDGQGFKITKVYPSKIVLDAETDLTEADIGYFGYIGGVGSNPKDPDYGKLYLIERVNGNIVFSEMIDMSINGEQGIEGPSAYQVAVSTGFEGNQVQWLDSLKGKDGVDGISPTITPTITADSYTLTITQKDTDPITTPNLKGANGQAGQSSFEWWKEFNGTPEATEQQYHDFQQGSEGGAGTDLQIGEVTTGAPGTPVIIEEQPGGTQALRRLDFTIPRGADGAPGNNGDTPRIQDGIWWIGETNTGVKAEAVDGHTPIFTVVNDNWYIDGVDTGSKAKGENGNPGTDGVNGKTWKPTVTNNVISWTQSEDPAKPTDATITTIQGEKGEDGSVWVPSVSATGDLSWTKDAGTDPIPVKIKGADATINVTSNEVEGFGVTCEPAGGGNDITLTFTFPNNLLTTDDLPPPVVPGDGELSIQLGSAGTLTTFNANQAESPAPIVITPEAIGAAESNHTHLEYLTVDNDTLPGTLNTNNTDSLEVLLSENLTSAIQLHKIAKTAAVNDLIPEDKQTWMQESIDDNNVAIEHTHQEIFNHQYIIIYQGNGGTPDLQFELVQKGLVPGGKEITPPEGKTFFGWKGGDLNVPISNNMILIADYEQQKKTVTFISPINGVISNNGPFTVNYGSTLGPLMPTITANSGYEFKRWESAPGVEFTANTSIITDMIISAIIEEVQSPLIYAGTAQVNSINVFNDLDALKLNSFEQTSGQMDITVNFVGGFKTICIPDQLTLTHLGFQAMPDTNVLSSFSNRKTLLINNINYNIYMQPAGVGPGNEIWRLKF